MERRVRLPEGELAYIWTRKRVKNWNLRVSPDGTVTLSTPTGVTGAEADRYVIGKAVFLAFPGTDESTGERDFGRIGVIA